MQAGFVFRSRQPHPQRNLLPRRRSLPTLHEGTRDPQASSVANDEAIQKISVLETELAKLRAQIAQIVLAQERSTQPGRAHTVNNPYNNNPTIIHTDQYSPSAGQVVVLIVLKPPFI